MKTKLLNISVIVLTIVLWGLQMTNVFPKDWAFTKIVKNNILLIASISGSVVVWLHLWDMIHGRDNIRRKWLKQLFSHIITAELGGKNYYTKVSLLRPRYGYQIFFQYLFYCFFLSFYDNTAKRKWKLRIKNIPIHFRTQYLTIYARYSYPKMRKSYTHIRITDMENEYNGIAEKAYRDGVVEHAKSLRISNIDMSTELELIPSPDRSKIKRYMKDFHFSDYYYNTLQNINLPPNHIIAVPILKDDADIWGVVTVDINSENYESFNDKLFSTIENYANIISRTLFFILPMETIRVIKKNGFNQIVTDQVRQIHGVRLSPIDKPAFVELRESAPRKMVFEYPHSKEQVGCVRSANGRFTVEFGRVSGRIKMVIPQQNYMSDTDIYELSQSIRAKGSGVRFKFNVETQMAMVGKLLPELSI